MVSVASITAAILYPILTLFLYPNVTEVFRTKEQTIYVLFSVIISVLIVFNHRSNIVRLYKGGENKFSFGKKDKLEESNEN